MTSRFQRLPALTEQKGHACPKPSSSLAMEKDATTKADEKALAAWQRAVYVADEYRCRCCRKPVVRTLRRQANQAQAHHVTQRAEQLVRYDIRNGLTLCRICHDRVTGKVNDKLIVVATKYFTVNGQRFTNARAKVLFRRLRPAGRDEASLGKDMI